MGSISFILGGTRSGKSLYAVELAKKYTKDVLFLATAVALDREMSQRIMIHRKNRPSNWKTIVETKDITLRIKNLPKKFKLIIIDCLTLFISNLLHDGHSDKYIENKIKTMLKILKKSYYDSIIVSNEVGLGIVPDNYLARRFRDLAGRTNQLIAHQADKVYFMVAGSAIDLKGVNPWKK